MTVDVEAALRQLLDERAVREVTLRYTFCLDARDWDGVAACFTPDAWIDYQDLTPGPRDEFLPRLRAAIEQFALTQHLLTGQLVEPGPDGDHVTVRSYAVAYHRLAGDGPAAPLDLVAGVHYDDVLERRDEGWLISRRVVTTPWLRQDPVVGAGPMVPDGI